MAFNLTNHFAVAERVITQAVDNPVTFVTFALVAVTALIAAPKLLFALMLSALRYIGFGVGGVIGGTWAAWAQASLGNVVTHSFFATLTSAGAGGYGVAYITSIAQWIVGVGGAMVTMVAVAPANTTIANWLDVWT